MTGQIVAELYRTLLLLGADHQLLGTVGSWADGLSDEEVLSSLQAWNSATAQDFKARTEHYESTCSFRDDNLGGNQKSA